MQGSGDSLACDNWWPCPSWHQLHACLRYYTISTLECLKSQLHSASPVTPSPGLDMLAWAEQEVDGEALRVCTTARQAADLDREETARGRRVRSCIGSWLRKPCRCCGQKGGVCGRA